MNDLPTRTQGVAMPARRPGWPFDLLEQETSRLFDSFARSFGLPAMRLPAASWSPQVDVTLTDGVLTLRGEKRSEQTDAERHVTERFVGRFSRAFQLPSQVDDTKVTAAFENGVLRIVLPKRADDSGRTRRIPIGAGQAAS
jgi:HSP20 family molecular chaperone IbpA